MSEQRAHRLLQLVLGSLAAITLVVLIVEPMLGLLCALLAVLGCVIAARVRPAVWRAEKKRWQRRLARIKDGLFSDGSDEEPEAPAVYDLVVIKPNTGKRYPVNRKTYLIGRGKKCDCKLGSAGTLGREHCRIVYREHSREYYIEDLRSRNGTYLGTHRLEPNTQEKLLENSEIYVGEYCLRFVKRTGS